MSALPLPEGYVGAINSPEDFARCSTSRQITIMGALLRLMEIYRDAEGSTQRHLHARVMNEWIKCSSIIAHQAGQTRPLADTHPRDSVGQACIAKEQS